MVDKTLLNVNNQPFPEEGLSIEYKSEVTREIAAEICALLNRAASENKVSTTSYIYLGVDDKSRKLINNYFPKIHQGKARQDIEEKLMNYIQSDIRPRNTLGLIDIYSNHTPFCIEIKSLRNQIFRSKSKNRKHWVVYYRNGSETLEAPLSKVKLMMFNGIETSYVDRKISPVQKGLTFHALKKSFRNYDKDRNINFHLNGLNELYTPDDKFNLAAYIFSDQNPFTIKIAGHFNSANSFIPQEFGRSIIDEIDNSTDYINHYYNKVEYYIGSIKHRNVFSYPKKALREAIINGLIHRTYYDSTMSTQVNVFPDRIEVTSPGAVPGGLSIEDIEGYFSKPRNPALIRLLRRIRYTESYGTGIPRMKKYYRIASKEVGHKITIKLKNLPHLFTVILPNINYIMNKYYPRDTGAQVSNVNAKEDIQLHFNFIMSPEDKVMNYLKHHSFVTNKVITQICKVSRNKALAIIHSLKKSKKIKEVGKGRGVKYFPR